MFQEGCLTFPASMLEGIDFLRCRTFNAFSDLFKPITTARTAIVQTSAVVAVLAGGEEVSFEKTAAAGSVINARTLGMLSSQYKITEGLSECCRCRLVLCSWGISFARFVKLWGCETNEYELKRRCQ